MRRVMNAEPTPIHSVTIAMVTRIQRSRAETSGKRLVFLVGDFAEENALVRPQQVTRGENHAQSRPGSPLPSAIW